MKNTKDDIFKPPPRIYLQVGAKGEPLSIFDDITWCQDKIEDTDIEYIRMDLCKARVKYAAKGGKP